MFENTTLIAAGDSFVYGQLGNDLNAETCHARSWVSKLGSIGNFKSVVNLGEPGGCNQRSTRVLMDYLDQNYSHLENYLVIFGLSELHRYEFPMLTDEALNAKIYSQICCPYESKLSTQHTIIPIGPWKPDRLVNDNVLSSLVNYTKGYYTYAAHDVYAEKILTHQLTMLNSLLESLNINYYYTSTILQADFLKNFRFLKRKLKTIDYYSHGGACINMSEFLAAKKFQLFPCGHFDHDANEFLANYIHLWLQRTYRSKNAI